MDKRPRRTPGSGSIYERKDGMFEAKPSRNGRTKVAPHYFRTYREADEWLAKVTYEQKQIGVVPSGKRLTVEQYLKRWLATLDVRPSTRATYEGLVRKHLIPRLGRKRLAELQPSDVESMMRAMRTEDGASPLTARHARAVLRSALSQAQRENLLQRNVAGLAKPPKKVDRKVQVMSANDVQALLKQIEPDPLYPLVAFAIATGARLGEALALTWADVADDGSGVQITHSLYRGERVPTKTERSRRTLPLPPFVQAALKRQRLAVGKSDYVFPNSKGGPRDQTNVGHAWKRLQERMDRKPIRFHDLRHQAASAQLAMGASLREVMDFLGHSQYGITANLYTHLLPEAQQAAAERAERFFGATVDRLS